MELFIPGLLLFLISIGLSFVIAPRFTPLIVAVLSLAFLTYGVHQHYKMFAAEYRLSTWQESLKVYAPAVMIGAIILFVIYGILAFFSKGAVPIPPIPNITPPNINTVTNTVVNSLNKVANTLTNKKNDLLETVNETINKVNNQADNLEAQTAENTSELMNENKNKRNTNNLSRSFLETI